jgi:hypothetical protein
LGGVEASYQDEVDASYQPRGALLGARLAATVGGEYRGERGRGGSAQHSASPLDEGIGEEELDDSDGGIDEPDGGSDGGSDEELLATSFGREDWPETAAAYARSRTSSGGGSGSYDGGAMEYAAGESYAEESYGASTALDDAAQRSLISAMGAAGFAPTASHDGARHAHDDARHAHDDARHAHDGARPAHDDARHAHAHDGGRHAVAADEWVDSSSAWRSEAASSLVDRSRERTMPRVVARATFSQVKADGATVGDSPRPPTAAAEGAPINVADSKRRQRRQRFEAAVTFE